MNRERPTRAAYPAEVRDKGRVFADDAPETTLTNREADADEDQRASVGVRACATLGKVVSPITAPIVCHRCVSAPIQ